ncbi:MAG: hypothetical protein HOW73_37605 [Polyangiaceae bacterium]|nr:hypothetical protein [Polyangiaceae bacterium]
MNEYTRREEVRWILVSAVVLVSSVAGALGLMLTARGPVVADVHAREAAQALERDAQDLAKCSEHAVTLKKEVDLFRDDSKVLEQQPAPEPEVQEEPAPKTPKGRKPPKNEKEKPKPPKPKMPDQSAQAWPAAKPTYDEATRLVACKVAVEKVAPAEGKAVDGWTAIEAVAALKAPKQEDTPSAHLTTARQVFAAIEKAPIQAVIDQVSGAVTKANGQAATAKDAAASATIQQPLPRGVLGREVAISAGVLVSLIGLLVSFFSLRATSVRRSSVLTPYRKAVHPPERGLHAATILRLAAEPNGGEPGIVLGAALGGLLAAIVLRADADWYVAGVAAGLVIGLLVQTLTKSIGTSKRFRERSLAIAEIEKPAVPIVLVLQTVQPGNEDEFLGFFLKLSPTEAANAVEKLATQAEEQILIAADAQAMS